MPQNVYSWDIIHRFFPPEEIEKYRHQIINDWESGLLKNEEIWEKYGMCENTFYELTKRYSEENDDGLKDKSNVAPAHPTAAELRGMIALALCSFVFIQNLKASFG